MAVLRPKVPPRPSARPGRPAPPAPSSTDKLDDAQTRVPLHRRILFPPSSSTPSPRILHSPAHDVLDPLILDLIALTLRAYVSPWYNGAISRDPDKHFLQAVTNVLVHVVQALEVRLAAVDWSALVLHDLARVLAEHYRDWDLADTKSTSNGPTSHNLSRDQLFDRIHPHLAVHLVPPSDQQQPAAAAAAATAPLNSAPPLGARVDPTYLRALTDRLLKLVLPPEDYRSLAERSIVRELVVGIVFRTVFERVAQPWFLHALIAKQLEPRVAAARAAKTAQPTANRSTSDSVLAALPGVLQSVASSVGSWLAGLAAPASPAPPAAASQPTSPPLVDIPCSLVALATAVLPASPFLTHLVSLATIPLSFFSRPIASYLCSTVQSRIVQAETARSILEGIKQALFPVEGGWPAHAQKIPNPDRNERDEWQRRAEVALAETLPEWLPTVLVGPSSAASTATTTALPPVEGRLALARHVLRPLSSHTANVHLFILLLDLFAGKLAPELVTGDPEGFGDSPLQ